MLTRFVDFKGEIPARHPRLLPESAAQVAINTRLEDGSLVPMNASNKVFELPDSATSIFLRPDGVWLAWDTEVNAAPGPVNADRTYVMGDGVPKVIYSDPALHTLPLALARPLTVLVAVESTPAAVAASGTITFVATGPTNGQVITIGGVAYQFVTALSVGPTVPNQIKTNATPGTVAASLSDALNGVTGATVSTGTVANPLVHGTVVGAVVTVTADTAGLSGNVIGFANSTPANNVVFVPGSGILGGGRDSGSDPDTVQDVTFSYTYVTILDEESQPALLSNEVTIDPTQTVTLSGYPDDATIAALGRGINRIRFYRSQTDAQGATGLFFISEQVIAVLGASFTFDPLTMAIAEPCPSVDYDPPLAGLRGIVTVPNGMMAAFIGKDLYIAEPYRPHAWPIKYSLTMDYDIVGLASIGSAIIVMTTGTPYMVQGTDPLAFSSEKILKNLPCVASRAIVDLGYAVAYPSTEGLVLVQSGSAQLITQQLFTRKQWQAFNAETFVASQHIGRYVFSYDPSGGGADPIVGIIDVSGSNPYFIQSEEVFTAAFFELGSGKLFILVDGTDIREWDSLESPRLSQTWRTRLLNLASPTNFGCVLVETDGSGGSTIEVDVIADGVVKHTVTVRDQVARLPSGFNATRWELEYRGKVTVTSISIAHSPSEFAQP